MLKLLLFTVIATLFSFVAHADSLSDARAELSQYKAASQAAAEANAKGDTEAAQGHQAAAQGALQKAKNIFESTEAGDSDDPAVLKDYAEVLMLMSAPDLAADVYRRLAEKTPSDPLAWFLLGRSLSMEGPGGAAEAVQALNKSLDLDAASPDAVKVLLLLGKVYRMQGLQEFAQECAEKAIAIDPANMSVKLAVIVAKVNNGDVAGAAADLDALGALPPEAAAGFAKVLGEAVDDYQASHAWYPDTADNHLAYARVLFRAGKVETSLLAAERAASLTPDSYVAWNLIGALSNQLGDKAKAVKAYQRSLEINADQPRTLEALEALGRANETATAE